MRRATGKKACKGSTGSRRKRGQRGDDVQGASGEWKGRANESTQRGRGEATCKGASGEGQCKEPARWGRATDDVQQTTCNQKSGRRGEAGEVQEEEVQEEEVQEEEVQEEEDANEDEEEEREEDEKE